jgi:hypothetical protein
MLHPSTAPGSRRLLHTDERVDIIAERIGYADPTHFIRLFRRGAMTHTARSQRRIFSDLQMTAVQARNPAERCLIRR